MSDAPETILQFGAGRFLRAFADLFVQQALSAGQDVGRIVIVQSTEGDRARLINRQDGRFHVLVRASLAGSVVERTETVECVGRALTVRENWHEVLSIARSGDLRQIISNTAERGYELDEGDGVTSSPRASFPARLLALLAARHEAGLPGGGVHSSL